MLFAAVVEAVDRCPSEASSWRFSISRSRATSASLTAPVSNARNRRIITNKLFELSTDVDEIEQQVPDRFFAVAKDLRKN